MMQQATARRAIDGEDRALPEVLLPIQIASRRGIAPERALLAGVLLDAVECFQNHYAASAGPRRQLFEEAEEWLFGADGGAPFSFEDVCELLSLDAECLRHGLRKWQERQTARALAHHRRQIDAPHGEEGARTVA